MTLAPETGIIYGPVHSRRLGLSLGVNLLPVRRKTCSFDCLYCYYGPTDDLTLTPDPALFPAPDTVLDAIERALYRHQEAEFLTFAGNGEPTLHPHFAKIVDQVRALRDARFPQVRLALFSNASTLSHAAVRAAVGAFEMPMLKLDAGDSETFRRLNRPAPGLCYEAIVAALRLMPHVVIQSVLIEGPVSNAHGAAFEAWLAAIAQIRPTSVHIYSTDYPVGAAKVERVPPYVLRSLAVEAARRTGVRVEPYWA